ncbi:GTP cyclohydrolase II [Streptomyces sp. NBC_01378]|uniref:GTP cyclohydrolase II n=1 Tax=Streptomyces sp. NBC_01378 TaxID=2903844 RepID=UPI00386D4DE3
MTVPLRFGDGSTVTADLATFHHLADGQEHVAVILGEPATGRPPLVRLHSECLTGDVFRSARCDCGPQLCEAVERIADRGGVLLYLRQEGRGIGLRQEGGGICLYNKLDAYALQDQGLDTYEANAALGLPEDARDYTAAAQMLAALGIFELDLLSNNPDKAAQLRTLGLTVTQHVPTGVFTTAHNVRYLRTKAVHTQHTLPLTELTAG